MRQNPGTSAWLCAALLLLAAGGVQAAGSAWKFNFDLGAVGDDNVNNAAESKSQDILEDKFVAANLGVGYTFRPSFRSQLNARGEIFGEQYEEFEGLNNVGAELGLDYRIQFSRGFTAPSWGLSLLVREEDYESDMRDSTYVGIQGTMAKRLTDRMATTLGLGYRNRESESEVFDLQNARLFANLDLLLGRSWVTYGTLSFVTGEIVSSSSPSIYIIEAAKAIEPDTAFPGFFAYKLDANTGLITLGLNWGINQHNALDASYRYIQADAEGGVKYQRSQFRFTYLLAF